MQFKFILKDVRCFEGTQEFNIRPLTFLVGENSVGKSTVLGCLQTLNSFLSTGLGGVDFNKPPYKMGTFSDILRKSKSPKDIFQMGIDFFINDKNVKYLFTLKEKENSSEPIVDQLQVVFPDGEIVLKNEKTKGRDNTNPFFFPFILKEYNKIKDKFFFTFTSEGLVYHDFIDFLWFINDFKRYYQKAKNKTKNEKYKKLVGFLNTHKKDLEQLQMTGAPIMKTLSFAPIRSKPERTYNPLKGTFDPEGSSMPMVLLNLFRSNKEKWSKLKTALIDFGKDSGLFTDITVKQFEKAINNPFQIHVKSKGQMANLIDVGYGVSQILPILVDILLSRKGFTFLLQQPEVHLHPRGQAALSSLMASLIKSQKNSFIVETHSDYMIDRVRIDIMNKKISPDDVSLIYLEHNGKKVEVHNITFDKLGNMEGAPPSYRDFFLKETDRLLGFKN